jgi:RNA polymerase sigma factor (sigma-70 family)
MAIPVKSFDLPFHNSNTLPSSRCSRRNTGFCFKMVVTDSLIKKCIEKDRKAQSELYRLSFSLLMSIAYRYHSNKADALAILNQCFLKILNGLEAYSKQNKAEHYPHWISRIMINSLIDEYRTNKKYKTSYKREVKVEQSLEQAVDYNRIEESIEAEELQAMLNRLNELQKTIFNLFVIDGYSHKEISQMLSISISNSKWNLSMARKQLKLLLRELVNKPVI